MKNPAPYIREQLVVLLNETITYDSVDVPCYEGEGEVMKYQILLVGQLKSNRSTRDSFNWQCEQRVEVISEQETNVHAHVDAIGAEVMNRIKPTPKTHGFTNSSDFQIGVVRIEIMDYIDEPSGEGTMINRLPLRITFLITQI